MNKRPLLENQRICPGYSPYGGGGGVGNLIQNRNSSSSKTTRIKRNQRCGREGRGRRSSQRALLELVSERASAFLEKGDHQEFSHWGGWPVKEEQIRGGEEFGSKQHFSGGSSLPRGG